MRAVSEPGETSQDRYESWAGGGGASQGFSKMETIRKHVPNYASDVYPWAAESAEALENLATGMVWAPRE